MKRSGKIEKNAAQLAFVNDISLNVMLLLQGVNHNRSKTENKNQQNQYDRDGAADKNSQTAAAHIKRLAQVHFEHGGEYIGQKQGGRRYLRLL